MIGDKCEVGRPQTGLNPQWCFYHHWPYQGGTLIFTFASCLSIRLVFCVVGVCASVRCLLCCGSVWERVCKCGLLLGLVYAFVLRLLLEILFLYLYNGKAQWEEVQCTGTITLFCLITELLPFVTFSCQEHNLKTTGWNFIKLHAMVKRNERKCRV